MRMSCIQRKRTRMRKTKKTMMTTMFMMKMLFVEKMKYELSDASTHGCNYGVGKSHSIVQASGKRYISRSGIIVSTPSTYGFTIVNHPQSIILHDNDTNFDPFLYHIPSLLRPTRNLLDSSMVRE